MCTTCGCGQDDKPKIVSQAEADHSHDHSHNHEHHHHHDHDHNHELPSMKVDRSAKTIKLEQDILYKNNQFADQTRSMLKEKSIIAINLVSSPGSGKTTLLEKTIKALNSQIAFSVIEGDQATFNDARRIKETGCDVVQINTGAGCHLEADMISQCLQKLEPQEQSLIFIENVGNLVCPALFDLGENLKAVILSVTEGEDKPLKYPHMFKESRLMIINKIDLLPYVEFDIAKCIEYARKINPDIEVLQVSATKGDGLDNWYQWLTRIKNNLNKEKVSSKK